LPLEEKKAPIISGKRPSNSNDVTTIVECEKWRMQILRDIGKKIMEIQNESLGEQRIRDLNDEINKLIREKGHWERKILELGGANYRKSERIADDAFVVEQISAPGLESQKGHTYKYFGAARNLPGVKELFEKKPLSKKAKYDYKRIDVDYYGYRDEDDQLLTKLEEEASKKAIAKAIKAWERDQQEKESDLEGNVIDRKLDTKFMAPVPTKEQMEVIILNKKKEDLLHKYASDQITDNLEKGKDEDFKRTTTSLKYLPVFILRPLVYWVGFLGGSLGLNIPILGVRKFAFGSCLITSVGMLGLDQAFVPFPPYARIPLLVMIGAFKDKPVVIDKQIEIRPMLTVTATLDHRFIDGAQAALLAKKFREVMGNAALFASSFEAKKDN